MAYRLKRTVQCAKCPWKVSTDPHQIPDGYDPEKHKALAATIAGPDGNLGKILNREPLRSMACHHSFNEHPEECVGWLNQQLGVGGNIQLRLALRDCPDVARLKVVGPQHETFADTLPKTDPDA